MLTIGDRIYDSDRPLVMGVLNITPDSFYDGGRYADGKRAVEHALRMVDEGADIIDIGGESSRPGAEPVDEDEEIARIIPVVEALAGNVDVPLSVDTYKARVAKRALETGTDIINDISALRFDSDMAEVISDSRCTVVLMHMLGTPRTMQKSPHYDDVVGEILAFLRERVAFAVEHGVLNENIIVDPGIGFGKTLEHNLEILGNIARFRETGCPVLVGASRKSVIGGITGAGAEDRLWGTAAIAAHCVMQGVLIHRVHDVREIRQVCDVAAAIRNGVARTAGV